MAISLSTIAQTGGKQAPRIIVYGVHGIGKSTFASQAAAPVFIQTEDGLAGIDTSAFPLAKTFDDVMEALRSLYAEDHKFKTVIIDSLDWLERLVWQHTAKAHAKENIEDFGYGKGYMMALDYWRQVFDGLNALRDAKGMTVVCLAHSEIKRFDAPDSEPYDRYQPKLHKAASAVVQEWADIVAFTNYKVMTKETDTGFGAKRTRAVGNGERLLYLHERPSHLAKTRYVLPESMPLDWPTFANSLADATAPAKSKTAKPTK